MCCEKADDDDGVFFDWSSLYQEPRSEDQERLFKEGLRASWSAYSTFRAECIVLSELPEEFSGHSHWQSGRCYMEFLMSTICQRIVNSKDPSISEHMVPEWLVPWRERLRDSMHFHGQSNVEIVEGSCRELDLPVARRKS